MNKFKVNQEIVFVKDSHDNSSVKIGHQGIITNTDDSQIPYCIETTKSQETVWAREDEIVTLESLQCELKPGDRVKIVFCDYCDLNLSEHTVTGRERGLYILEKESFGNWSRDRLSKVADASEVTKTEDEKMYAIYDHKEGVLTGIVGTKQQCLNHIIEEYDASYWGDFYVWELGNKFSIEIAMNIKEVK